MVALRFGLALIALPLVSGLARTPQESSTEKREALYRWFDGLGYDAVRKGQFVKCVLACRPKSGNAMIYTEYGFLVATTNNGFSILTPDLQTREFPEINSYGTTAGTFSKSDFNAWVIENQKQRKSYHFSGNGGSADIGCLAIARACALRGLRSIEEYYFELSCSWGLSLEVIERDFVGSNRMLTKSTVNFELANSAIPITRILADFRVWVAKNKDVSDEYMSDSCGILNRMVEEDRTHPKYTQRQLDELTVDQRIKELIYQIRNAAEEQNSNPGDVDFLGTMWSMDHKPDKTDMRPAVQLYRLGMAAVPQLIDALSDQSFTRSQRMMRIPEGEIPRVQDAVLQILEAIAGRSFYDNNEADHRMYIGGDPDGLTFEQRVKRIHAQEHEAQGKRIRRWWADIKTKGGTF